MVYNETQALDRTIDTMYRAQRQNIRRFRTRIRDLSIPVAKIIAASLRRSVITRGIYLFA